MKTNNMKFLQANLQHSRAASMIFSRTFEKNNITIGLLTEPYYSQGKIRNLSGGKLIYNSTTGERPRACIYLHKDIQCFVLNEFCSNDVVAVGINNFTINGKTKDLIVCSTYMDSTVQEIPTQLTNLLNHCKSKNMNLIIGTDSNAHHTLWGSRQSNNRGDLVLDFIVKNDLNIKNRGNKPTFINSRSETIIDLTLTRAEATDMVRNWRVTNDISGSDHMHIQYEILNQLDKSPKYRNKYSTNWDLYKIRLKENLTNVQRNPKSISELDEMAMRIKEAIVEAFEFACPEKCSSSKNANTPWWNRKLEKIKNECSDAFKKAKKHKRDRPELWADYKEINKKYKMELREAKQSDWENFCTRLENIQEGARIHKILSKEHKNEIGSLRKEDGTHTKNEKETLRLLTSTHFPDSNNNLQETFVEDCSFRNLDIENSRSLFTEDKIKWSVNSFEPFKSGGTDQIFPALLQKGIELLWPFLQELFIFSHCTGFIPKDWREAKVVYIPKAGKRPSDEVKSYRPISLTSFLLKTMERILDRMIRDDALKKNPICGNQFAYQEGKSTITALQSLIKRIRKIYTDKEIGIAVSIDIQGAFDNASYDKIKEALIAKGIDTNTCNWIDNMLRKRRIVSNLGHDSIIATPTRGCPQGGVLSPLLWCLLIDQLLVKLKEHSYIKVQAFADDIIIMVIGISGSTVSQLTQIGLNVISKWCGNQGLKISTEKTIAVKFTLCRKEADKTMVLKLSNGPIKYSNHMKYLGVILDSKLNFKAHLENKLRQAYNALWTCKSFIGRRWGMSPKMIHWMYTAIVRPMITYASLVWFKEASKKSYSLKLEKLQRLACIMITGAMKTTPTSALETMLHLPPLHLYMKSEAKMANFKLSTDERQDLKKITDETLNKEQEKDLILSEKVSDAIVPKYFFDLLFKVEIPTREQWSSGDVKEYPDALKFYTDGSKTNDGTGFGIHGTFEISRNMSNLATVFQAEAKALATFAEHIRAQNVQNRNIIIIYSDTILIFNLF